MLSIKKNPDIKLKIPEFICDDSPLGEHLNEHDCLKLLNCYGLLCIVGQPGQGKTSLAIAMITQNKPKIYRKTHEHIILIIPEESVGSLKKNPFKVLPPENIYHELTDKTITAIFQRLKEYSKLNEKTLIFIDDMTAHLKKSMTIIMTLKEINFNRRHLKTNIIITAQSYSNIPLDVRKNIKNLIIFKPCKKEMELLFIEHIQSKRELFTDVMNITYDKEGHNFLFVNTASQRMFKNFDEIIFPHDDKLKVYNETIENDRVNKEKEIKMRRKKPNY